LALTAVGNTAANRRLTFGLRGRRDVVRHHIRGAVVFVLTVAITTGAVLVMHGIDPSPPRTFELAVLIVAGFMATVTRYVAMSTWVFTRRRRRRSPRSDAPYRQLSRS
jgi:putative flippase GtrA